MAFLHSSPGDGCAFAKQLIKETQEIATKIMLFFDTFYSFVSQRYNHTASRSPLPTVHNATNPWLCPEKHVKNDNLLLKVLRNGPRIGVTGFGAEASETGYEVKSCHGDVRGLDDGGCSALSSSSLLKDPTPDVLRPAYPTYNESPSIEGLSL